MSKMSIEKIERKLNIKHKRYWKLLEAYHTCGAECLLIAAKIEHEKMKEWEAKLENMKEWRDKKHDHDERNDQIFREQCGF